MQRAAATRWEAAVNGVVSTARGSAGVQNQSAGARRLASCKALAIPECKTKTGRTTAKTHKQRLRG